MIKINITTQLQIRRKKIIFLKSQNDDLKKIKKRSSFQNQLFYENRKKIIFLQAEIDDLKILRQCTKGVHLHVSIDVDAEIAKASPPRKSASVKSLDGVIADIKAQLPAPIKKIKTRRVLRTFDGLHWVIDGFRREVRLPKHVR